MSSDYFTKPEKPFLLHYSMVGEVDTQDEWSWFDTEEDLQDFVLANKRLYKHEFMVEDAIEIGSVRELEIPNDTTLAAIQEAEQIINNKDRTTKSVDELFNI